MVGIYLSGTGNTKYCIEKLVSLIHSSAKAIPMESPEAISAIQQNEEIYIGYGRILPVWERISLPI